LGKGILRGREENSIDFNSLRGEFLYENLTVDANTLTENTNQVSSLYLQKCRSNKGKTNSNCTNL
jgi:archaellum component FlaC